MLTNPDCSLPANEERFWNEIKHALKMTVRLESYTTWIAPLQLLELDTEVRKVVIEAPNDLARDWLDLRYRPLFITAIEAVLGSGGYHVLFVTQQRWY